MIANPQASALFDQGVAACRAGQVQRGMELFAAAVDADPSSAELLNRIAFVMSSHGALPAARAVLIEATRRFPGHAGTFNNLGSLLLQMGDTDGAVRNFSEAVRLAPSFSATRFNFARLLEQLGEFDRAIELLREVEQRDPQQAAEASLIAGYMFRNVGLLADAIASFDRASTLAPDDPRPQSASLYTMWFHDRFSRTEIVERHVDWARRVADPLTAQAAQHENDRDPTRRLRIAYVTPLIRDHVASLLCEPIFANHDRANFEVCVYATAPEVQSHALRLRPLVDRWTQSERMSDAELAAKIRDDRIDILIDLNLHMAMPRVLMAARKPAPVQIGHLGYPATTGMRAFDYRVTCPALDPSGAERSTEPERLLRLPHTFWCYHPNHELPVETRPGDAPAPLVFGCLNVLVKISDSCLRVWAQILEKISSARLALAVHGGARNQAIVRRLNAAGIDPARVDRLGYLALNQHLKRLSQIDVSLDPFPYGGHVSAMDSLWMGVPIVTLAGDSPVSRAGACILGNLGLSDLVAQTTDEYVDLAIQLANDRARRDELRRNLRAMMLASPLTDAKRYVRHLEAGYRAAWQRWCADTPPVDINVENA